MSADAANDFYAPPLRDTAALHSKLEALTSRDIKIAERSGAEELTEAQFDAGNKAARTMREGVLAGIANLVGEAREVNTLTAMRQWHDMPLIEGRDHLGRTAEINLYPKYHPKNIPPAEQVVVFVRNPAPDGTLFWMLAAREHPDVD